MSELVLICAESGSGKSYSMRNMNPDKTLIVSVEKKRPPFSLKSWPLISQENPKGSRYVSNNYGKIKKAVSASVEQGKTAIVIDDSQFLMANSFFNRAHERGFDKFNELGQNFWLFLDFLQALPENVIVYMLHHVDRDESGKYEPKTLGKMIKDKGCMEGRFSICLSCYRENGTGYFSSNVEGQNMFKAPPGMLEKDPMDNDLSLVDVAIREYWGI